MKTKRTMRTLSVVLATIFAASMMLFSSCSSAPSRDEYDPYLHDEEACRELYRISRSASAAIHGATMYDGYMISKPLAEAIMELFQKNDYKDAIALSSAVENIVDYENKDEYEKDRAKSYHYGNERLLFAMEYEDALELNNRRIKFDDWEIEQQERVYCFLFKQSGMDIFPSCTGNEWKEVDIEFKADLEEKLNNEALEYYNSMNAPQIESYELIYDSHADYQVWKIYFVGENYPMQVQVLFDEDGKRRQITHLNY